MRKSLLCEKCLSNEVISNQEKINDTCETERDLKFFDDLLNENTLPPDVSNVENDFQDNKEEIDISCDMILHLAPFSGFWKLHGSKLWKDKAIPTISIDGLQSSLHKMGNLLSLSLSN
ncbi:hypothetical protein Tco_0073505 [Tanacetum coccineum]